MKTIFKCFPFGILTFALACESLAFQLPSQHGAKRPLDATTVEKIFQRLTNDDRAPYALGDVRSMMGSFTQNGADEAIVSFRDDHQSHASGWSELWLLSFDKGWKTIRKLEDADGITFRIVDIDGDGRDEVFVISTSCFQGCETSAQLLSINKRSDDVLYTWGEGHNSEIEDTHPRVQFEDIDHDGRCEIIDTLETSIAVYKMVGKKFEAMQANVKSQRPLYVVKDSPSGVQVCAHSLEQMQGMVIGGRDYGLTERRLIERGNADVIKSGTIGTVEVNYQTLDEFEFVRFYVPNERKSYYLFKSAVEPIDPKVAKQRERPSLSASSANGDKYQVLPSEWGYQGLAPTTDLFEALLLAYQTDDDRFFAGMVAAGNIHIMRSGTVVYLEREQFIKGTQAAFVRTEDGRTGWMFKKVISKIGNN